MGSRAGQTARANNPVSGGASSANTVPSAKAKPTTLLPSGARSQVKRSRYQRRPACTAAPSAVSRRPDWRVSSIA